MEINEGNGWRLRIDPRRRPYGALIGGDLWAVELRPRELRALQRAVARLEAQYLQLQPTLMAEEELDLELDLELEPEPPAAPALTGPPPDRAGCLHVALTAAAGGWALRFVLMPADGARAVEGGWSAAASPSLAAALAGLPAELESAAVPPPC